MCEKAIKDTSEMPFRHQSTRRLCKWFMKLGTRQWTIYRFIVLSVFLWQKSHIGASCMPDLFMKK